MRPVRRGPSPSLTDFKPYSGAKSDLISKISFGSYKNQQIGHYCSYCERRIPTNLAIEHIQPKKGDFGKPELEGRWENFLLSCVNCNSSKGSTSVYFDYYLFPDRDNTFYAFEYFPNGQVQSSRNNSFINDILANNTLKLFGLDKDAINSSDTNLAIIAQDRVNQRREAWATAQDSLLDYENNQAVEVVKHMIVKLSLSVGFFSIWMAVFKDHEEMKNLFINSISGTRESGCFDSHGVARGSHPNQDRLQTGRNKNFNTPVRQHI